MWNPGKKKRASPSIFAIRQSDVLNTTQAFHGQRLISVSDSGGGSLRLLMALSGHRLPTLSMSASWGKADIPDPLATMSANDPKRTFWRCIC